MKEQISAFMDDELDTQSSAHLLTALEGDTKLHECWTMYHLIGDGMRDAPQFSAGFQQRLMQRLEQEPTVLAPPRKTVFRPPLILSAAASVAAVLFVGWMVLQQQTAPKSALPTMAENAVSAESVDSYLLAHHDFAPENGMQTAYYMRPTAYQGNDR